MNEEHAKTRRFNYSQTLIYFLIIGMMVLILGLDNHRDNQREKDRAADTAAAEKGRCTAGTDTRDVQRSIVEAIYNLATGFVKQDPNAPPLTAAEVVAYNAYIGQLNNFREDMYAKIKPADQCKKYVDDDVVGPPTPSVPLLPVPKE